MHSLLKRQIKKYFPDESLITEQDRKFFDAMDEYYKQTQAELVKIKRIRDLGAIDVQIADVTPRLKVEKKEAKNDQAAQDKSKANEAHYRAIYEAVGDVIYETDYHGILTSISASVEKYTGQLPENLIGKPVWELFVDPNDYAALAAEITTKGGLTGYEIRIKGIDGKEIIGSFSAQVLFDQNGQPIGTQGIARDITEQIESNREAEDLLRFASEAVGMVNTQTGLFERVNEAAEKLFGMSREEIIRIGPAQISPEYQPDGSHSQKKAMEKIEEALNGGVPVFEWIIKDATGKLTPCEVRLVGMSGAQSHKIRFTITDITARMKAEQKLRESQQFLQTVMDNIPESIFWKDKNLTYLGCNRAFADDAGLTSPSEIIGKTDWELPWKDQAELYRGDDRLVMDKQEPKLNYEEPQTTPDGAIIWLRTSKIPIKDASGKVNAILGMYEDITERKQTEKQIQESQQRLALFVENSPLAAIEWDTEFKVRSWNKAAESIFGYTAEEAFGRHAAGLIVPAEYREAVDTVWNDLLAQRGGNRSTNGNTTKDGRAIMCDWFNTPLVGLDGKTLGVASLVLDITERKALEQQIQATLERRNFQVKVSTQISQRVASATDTTELYKMAVKLVKEELGYYHVQLLRYDPASNEVVLIEGYGNVGTKMKDSHHRMPMGIGLIGTAAATGQVMLRPNLKNDPDWRPNPLLPETKGEIAVPIKLGDEVLGVLDVQSNIEDALSTDDQLLLEGLCGQIAIAIQDTRLRDHLNEQLRELNTLQRANSRAGWQAMAQSREGTAFVYEEAAVRPLSEADPAAQPAIAPISIRDEVIGAIGIYEEDGKPLSLEEQELLESISGQVAQALESARLFEQAQKRAAELQTVATVSTATSTMLDPDSLLQTVVDLTKERFSLYHAHIYLFDESWKTLLLAAGAGEIGKQMVEDGWNIPLGHPTSLVASAARNKSPIIAEDVRRSRHSAYLSNRLLPDTRSEMAVPMIVGDKVLGVFDVQSTTPRYFSEEDAKIYTTLAAQVGIALQNARLYVEQAATLAQLRELDRLKSSFLANMSHELRTPLNSILGFADVMLEELDGPLTENMDNDLKLIQKNGQHLLHLINDVLDMAKIEAGRMNLNPEKFRVHDIFEDVLSITSSIATERNNLLYIEKDSDTDVEIFADRTRLRQVMINLVNNAMKFTEKGQISLRVSHQDDLMTICVRDNGTGIPPEKLEDIFLEFTQVDTSTTRKVGGTGLGLPISRRLIEMHGGRLWAESTGIYGEGSTFYVELPLEAIISDQVEVEKVQK